MNQTSIADNVGWVSQAQPNIYKVVVRFPLGYLTKIVQGGNSLRQEFQATQQIHLGVGFRDLNPTYKLTDPKKSLKCG